MMDEAGRRVLIIGGTRERIAVLREILSREVPSGAEPEERPLGEDGLRALGAGGVDLALILAPPDLDGMREFVREVIERCDRIPFLVLRSDPDPAASLRAIEAGEMGCDVLDEADRAGVALAIRHALDRGAWERESTRLHALIGVAREVLSVIDAEGVVRYTSPSIERVLGYGPDEREGVNALHEVHPDDRPLVAEALQRVLDDPSHRPHVRYRMRHRDGGWRVHDVTAENRLADPAIRGIVVSALDVTDEVERDERIRYQASLLNAVGQAVIATDVEGTVVFWNRAAEELYGWSREEAVGRSTVELTVSSDARDDAEAIMEILRGNERWSGEFRVRRRDGSTFLASVTNSPVIDSDGKLIGIIGVSGDITAERETRDALRERMKEMRTLYLVSRIMNEDSTPLGERLRSVVEEVPRGWLHPEVTEARLVLQDATVSTAGFRETSWMRSAPITSADRTVGRLDIAITEERSAQDDGPFLTEEGELLDALARIIGEAFERERLSRRVRQTIASLEEAVILLDREGDRSRIHDVNPAAERIFGYRRDELVDGGVELRDLFTDPQTFRRFEARATHALATSGVFRSVLPMRRKNGETLQADQTLTLLDPEEGVASGRVLTVRDASVRRRAEERFGVLSEEIVDHIYVLGPDLSVQYTTPSVTELAGTPKDEFEGFSLTQLLELVHPEDRNEVESGLLGVAKKPDATMTGQYRIVTREGEIRHVESLVRNLLDNPLIGGLVVTTRDVTERVELEQRLRQGQKMEAIGRLAGGIAHDFNNILTVIRSQTDLLLLGPPDADELAGELAVIQSSVDRAATLTSQLLAFSRDQLLQPRIVDLSEVVRSMVPLVDRMLGEHIALECDLPADLPTIEVDPGQLEQAVLNLAMNAHDAMPDGGTLTLAAYREDAFRASPGQPDEPPAEVARKVRTVLRVSDTGAGMDEDTSLRIFDPFFSTKGKGKGTGLGLAMVYGFVEQSGGTIRVESRPDEGSTFYLSFPAIEGSPTPSSMRPAARPSDPDEDVSGAVLLVEDDPAVRRAAQRILEGHGFTVTAFGDAESGLGRIQEGPAFDVVLTDFVLPGMNGGELVRKIREFDPGLPIVVMSGYVEGPSGQELELPSGVGFVQKPFTRDELVDGIRRVLRAETP